MGALGCEEFTSLVLLCPSGTMHAVSFSLPPLPRLPFVATAEHAALPTFVRVEAHALTFTAGPGAGRSCRYDLVRRRAIDAAVIVAFTRTNAGRRSVYLRSAVRPPLALRDDSVTLDAGLWELPAGLVEHGEAPAEAAARELHEELGLRVDVPALVPLGGAVVPAPALIGERQFGFAVDVTGLPREEPALDGSLLELGGEVILVDAADLAAHLERDPIVDAKTELFLQRFLRSSP
jgi:ADP-ribose pyrophosphatase